jgi:transposase
MCNHYLIDPVACTPASGWEKGQVENQVGLVRQRFFTPRLPVQKLRRMNAWLTDQCIVYAKPPIALAASTTFVPLGL